MDLTMRQLEALLKCIRTRNTTREYYHMAFHAKLHHAEIASLEDVLGVDLDEKPFDEKTDAMLDGVAERLLKERQNGKR